MTDWPGRSYHKPTISTLAAEFARTACVVGATLPAVTETVWPSANLGIFVPFQLIAPYPVTKLWWLNGSVAAGNVDCGIYVVNLTDGLATATLVASAGSTAQAGTLAVQVVTLGTSILLPPGNYELGLACSLATARMANVPMGIQVMRMCGCSQQASSVPMPGTQSETAIGQAYWPIFGMSNDPGL